MEDQLKRQVVQRLQNIMDMQSTPTGGKLRWFYCFGSFLEFMASRTFSLNYDIDIGVMYEDVAEGQLLGMFTSFGYVLDAAIRNDVDGKPLNMHFRPTADNLAGTPTVDVFMLYPYGPRRLYTYDIEHEGKERPSLYEFKVVPRRWMEPTEEDVDFALRGTTPEQKRILDDRTGIWRYCIYEPDSQFTFPVPFGYGRLLDLWYPGWWFRQNYKGQSKTLEWVKVKSCKELHD